MEESVLGEVRQYLGFAGMQGIAASPIMSQGGVQGILVVIRNTSLSPEETWFLSALADQAAISLANAHFHGTLVSREAKLQEEAAQSGRLARELEALIHAVAHDLRAPLETMTACGKLLFDEFGEQNLTEKSRNYLIRIASGADAMAALIQDLLAYTRLARAELELESVDLEDAVSEALAGLPTEIERRGGLVRAESRGFKVLAHRKTLVKILGHLLSNAVKFVGPGQEPRVEVKAESLGEFIRVSILDTGIGIAEESRDRIFGVFERLNRVEEYPGTGIGLAIVRRGVERMGGRSGVVSKLGQGSRFWIELREA
jgi:signal transduction histidine kinase